MRINVLSYLKDRIDDSTDLPALLEEGLAWSFGDIACRAAAVAEWLIQHTGASRRPVLVIANKSAHSICSFYGSLLSGNFYCPVDPRLPAARLKKIIDNLQPCAVIGPPDATDSIREYIGDAPILNPTELQSLELWKFSGLLDRVDQNVVDVDVAYVIYTSGSTGDPKGVVISHRSVIDYIEWASSQFDLSPEDRIASQAPFFFDNSVLDLYLSLKKGCALYLVPETTYMFPRKLIDYLETHQISFVFWVPSVLVLLAGSTELHRLASCRLRHVVFAGEAMPVKQLRQWMNAAREARYWNLYGPTEITVDCTFMEVSHDDLDYGSVPIGKQCRNTQVLIINDDGRLCAAGEPGELYVRGSGLALGYWRDPTRTQSCFVQNPCHSNYPDPVYKTGDLCEITSTGLILFHGRRDSQIKHMGYRIELGDIEAAAGLVPEVQSGVALYDAELQQLCLIYTAAREIPISELILALERYLPRYMVPRRFLRLDELPLTPNGKIDRRQLLQMIKGRSS